MPLRGSKGTHLRFVLKSCAPYATDPSAATLITPADKAGAIIATGSPSARPVSRSIGTRQMFMLPLRSLAKYRNRPSGDHAGFQFVEPPLVIRTRAPPAIGSTHTSRSGR